MDTLDLERLKSDEHALREALKSGGARFKGRACNCPFHDDTHASGGIFLDDGHWLFKCQPCGIAGSVLDVLARLNKRTVAEEIKAMNPTRTLPKLTEPPAKLYPTIEAIEKTYPTHEATYRYTNPETGKAELLVIRYWDTQANKKAFHQCHAVPGGFVKKGMPKPWPLYNRARLLRSDVVIVVEGEKCVHALHDIGITATTSPGGAGKAAMADWSPLSGKTVFLWPDNDPPNPPTHPKPGIRTGIEHMQEVQAILQQLPTPPQTILWINPDNLELPPKGDAADFIERYGSMAADEKRAAVECAVLAEAESIDPLAKYVQMLEDTIAGKRKAIPFPWPLLSKATRALMPGTVTCFVGDAGSGKSLAIMESVVCWCEVGLRPAVYELEDDKEYHLARAHAQVSYNAELTNTAWCELNGPLVRESVKIHRDALAAIERCLWASPDKQATLDELAAWAEERAKAGHQIIVIDPITAAEQTAKPWIADCEFITKVKTIARKYNTRVVFVIHPKKGYGAKGGATLDDLAGGAAYSRFSHTVIWLEVYDKDDELPVRRKMAFPVENLLPNRIARVMKARNGPGRGKRFAFDFKPESLRFEELGLIEKAGAS